MDRLTFDAPYVHVYEPSAAQIAASEKEFREKPRFCVNIMLARLNVANGNGHRIPVEQAEKAIEALGDKQVIPGNLDHLTAAYGASVRIWVEKDGKQYPELMLSAVYWNRYITDEKYDEIMASYDSSRLAASWEIDQPFELVADADDPDVCDVTNFGFGGFGLMVSRPPAEARTRGTAQITASLEQDADVVWGWYVAAAGATEDEKKAQVARSKQYGIGIKEGGNVTKPSKYSTVPDSQFADPVNYKYPIDEAHIKPAVQYFNHEGQREAGGYTTAEWAKIGGRIAKAAGEGYKYEGGKVVTPSTEASASSREVMQVDTYGTLPVDLLQSIPCPACGSRGQLKKLDFEKGSFELECVNYDRAPRHRYEVTVRVKLQGETAEYVLAGRQDGNEVNNQMGDVNGMVAVALKTIRQEVGDLEKKEYTPTEIEQIRQEAAQEAIVKQKEAEAALATQKEEMQAAIDQGIQQGLEQAKAEAVAVYKQEQAVVAKRVDEAHAILPFASDEEKATAMAELGAMTDEQFEHYKELRSKDKEIADLKASTQGQDPKHGINAGVGTGLPSGELDSGAEVKEPNFSALRRI